MTSVAFAYLRHLRLGAYGPEKDLPPDLAVLAGVSEGIKSGRISAPTGFDAILRQSALLPTLTFVRNCLV